MVQLKRKMEFVIRLKSSLIVFIIVRLVTFTFHRVILFFILCFKAVFSKLSAA